MNEAAFYIANAANGKVMDIECGNASAGARVIVFNKNQPQSKNQLWYQDRQDNIHSALNSFLLQATNPGDQLSMHPFSGRPDQEWRFKDGRIVNPSTGLCLGMKGSAVVASKEDESNGQQWRIEY